MITTGPTMEEWYEMNIYTECPYDHKNCDECWFDCGDDVE